MSKNFSAFLSFLLICGIVAYTFTTFKPQYATGEHTAKTQFATARALSHLKVISKKPHAVGTTAHDSVRDYLIQVLEEMGLEPKLQEDFAYKTGWGALSKAENIMARIRGTGSGKAVLVFSHYDSAPHTASYGASDAGTGVVTVLESIRAFLASGKKPKNDIIILFTDAEELGLNGASIFAKKHPWAKDVGVALNFEARGSGGPSNMIVETNGGNSKLIKAFAKANSRNPYANSLAYSVYKILPNDTDSTVMREFADIDGFFFAFLSDHFDYHTARDDYEHVDETSLEHQGRYLMPLLRYFAEADLDLKSDTDYVYMNIPVFKMLYYPFSWIWPLFILALLGFVGIIIYGISQKYFGFKAILLGFIPFLISLLASTGLAYLGYLAIYSLHPGYEDILQQFPYNGYYYITAAVSLSLCISFFIYKLFYKPVQTASLSIAPLFFWLLIVLGSAIYLPGASFFVIPLFFTLAAVILIFIQKKPNLLWLCFLSIPALCIVSPFIQQFPIGLGLVLLPVSALLGVFLFGLLLPVFGFYEIWGRLAAVFLLIMLASIAIAEFNSGFNQEQPFPSSINYVYDVDKDEAVWATYNKHPNKWIKDILGPGMQEASQLIQAAAAGKYNTNFTYAARAPKRAVAESSIYVSKNTVENGLRTVHLSIYPQRDVKDMILLSPLGTPFSSLEFNGQTVKPAPGEAYLFEDRKSEYLLNYRLSNREPLQIKATLPAKAPLSFTLYDVSYNLLDNRLFKVPSRPKSSMPMPFVFTDAIITKQDILLYKPKNSSTNE